MDEKDFHYYAELLIQWVEEYFKNIGNIPVFCNVEPNAIKFQLPDSPPDEGENFQIIFEDFKKVIFPGITHWQHPRFFAYFPANTSFPSILGELLSSALAPQCMMWLTSPAATELEEKVMDWLRQMIGLSNEFSGVIQDTASTSTLVALLVAREKASNYAINKNGYEFSNWKFTVYCSTEAHSSVEKAIRIAGIGSKNLRKIPVDNNYALRIDILRQKIIEDLNNGYTPLAVIGAFGTTSSTAFDPLEEIGEVTKEFGLWYHIDGAMAGSALILPEFSKYREGVNKADSFVFNPHKWLFVNFDCSAFFIKDKNSLINTFSLTPEYLQTDFDEKVNNFRDWGIQLGRRFRALKLWFVLRSFGTNGLKNKIRNHLNWAGRLAELIQNEPFYEILAPVNLNTICFRFSPKGVSSQEIDNLNRKLLDSINSTGYAFLSHTSLNGKFVIRFSIGQTNTTWDDVLNTWNLIKSSARKLMI